MVLMLSHPFPLRYASTVAKKHHCRSLASEAWFCEQLVHLQGVVIPASTDYILRRSMNNPPLTALRTTFSHKSSLQHRRAIQANALSSNSPSPDWVPDDHPAEAPEFFDNSNFKKDSPWSCWRLDDRDPTIAISVLELLGDPCAKVWQWGEYCEDIRDEILATLEDITAAGCDDTLAEHCHQHGLVHKWRIIDFDHAKMISREDLGKQAHTTDSKSKIKQSFNNV
ncbi:hypothetical protein BKA70DRAFT_1226109 [Coprinopsis sp. MPI-PUGE-AT-0042]|nr:hypothetical protein BKA70DRAFT_1226109 [Coprinopsis sp. MPI-PUGE-AT-0042]